MTSAFSQVQSAYGRATHFTRYCVCTLTTKGSAEGGAEGVGITREGLVGTGAGVGAGVGVGTGAGVGVGAGVGAGAGAEVTVAVEGTSMGIAEGGSFSFSSSPSFISVSTGASAAMGRGGVGGRRRWGGITNLVDLSPTTSIRRHEMMRSI